MRLLWVFITVTAAGLLGCTPAGSMSLGGTGQPTTMPHPDRKGPARPNPAIAGEKIDLAQAAANPSQYKLIVAIRLTTIEVPTGTASGSEEIWSYLDEQPVSPRRSVNLGRNGIRVGLGRPGAWADLAEVFKRMTGRAPSQNVVVAMPNDPFQIILREKQPEATIFIFRDDRTLRGRDYPAGEYLLCLSCSLDEDDLSKVMLTAMPQVRSTASVTRYVISKLGPQLVNQPEVFSFNDLTFQLKVPMKGFLVIGPGSAARNPATVGHHFLTHKREGVEYETLLVLKPEVIAKPLRPASASLGPARTKP